MNSSNTMLALTLIDLLLKLVENTARGNQMVDAEGGVTDEQLQSEMDALEGRIQNLFDLLNPENARETESS